MIRFGAVLTVVLVAMGLLAGGVLTNSLLLVYLAIGVAALSAIMLAVGLVIWRGDIFGEGSAQRAGLAAGTAGAAGTSGAVGTAPAPAGRMPVSQTAASAPLGQSTLLVGGGKSTVGRDDPAVPPPPVPPWRDLPEPEDLRERERWREPERRREPEPRPEPEHLSESERWPVPERRPEPEHLSESERWPVP
ncbi:MAG: hypothetical protein WB800_02075, partial [Streptosporangiaceae bacterium]